MSEENKCHWENGSLCVCPALQSVLNAENSHKDGNIPRGTRVGGGVENNSY